jgi:tetratricopeptide (TPR) repeat protein
MSHVGYYVGWYDGDVSGPFARPKVEFMPGAVAYHLHSFSASSLRTTDRHWVGPLLAKGATATLGCVEEPYLVGTPEMANFSRAFLYGGFSFGEAAYVCQASLSWQTTVVGDPLYRPFALSPQQRHDDLLARKSDWIEWSHLRLVNLGLVRSLDQTQLIEYLLKEPVTQRSAILLEKLGDLYYAQGKLFEAADAYRKALPQVRSEPQQLRMTMFLARLLALIDKEKEAYALYQKLLEEFPEPPDRVGVLQKLLPLAQKLKLTADAERYQIQLLRLAPPPPR